MISSAVLGKYAISLAEIVFEEKIEETVVQDLKTYGEIFRAVPDLLETFDSPAMPREAKEKVLGELTVRYPVHPISSNFLRVLLENNRIRYFQEILAGFLKAVDERKGIVAAQVIAAAPLSQEEVKGIQERLVRIMGKQVDVKLKTDETLLGGIVVQIGSTHFDGSLRRKLANMKRRLAET